MTHSGVGNIVLIDGTIITSNYIEVLRSNLPQSTLKLGINDSYDFQQDTNPKQAAKKNKITREWLLYNVCRRLVTRPQSPDVNPTDNLWHLQESELRK